MYLSDSINQKECLDSNISIAQANAVRIKTEERRYHKMAEAARKKEQELQKKAEAEVTERLNKKTCLSGATIDWDVVQI